MGNPRCRIVICTHTEKILEVTHAAPVDKAHNVLSCVRLPGSERKKGRACAVGSSSSAVSGQFFAFSKFVQEGTAGLTNFEKRGD
jgi:hypothetical protein